MTDGPATTGLPSLHVPDEPLEARADWHRAVLDGTELAVVLAGPAGPVEWLWRRWQVLARAGWTRPGFERAVVDYRRELWLWLAGERTWAQCCSGLIGRLGRRSPA